MKHLYLIFIFICWGCYGQLVVRDLYGSDREESGAYYKDTYNDFDKIVGTWKYTNGTTSLTIVLQKKLRQPVYDYSLFYEMDYIVGGYKYVENGVKKINTLAQLQQNMEPEKYAIEGFTIAGPQSVYCVDCGSNDRVFLLGYLEPNSSVFIMETEMLFQRADSGGVQKLKLDFRTLYSAPEDVTQPATPDERYTIPFGEYILTKVN